ncbi:hypothetical protein P9112_004736 [Eukaryota sp. TZLM1-RC]
MISKVSSFWHESILNETITNKDLVNDLVTLLLELLVPEYIQNQAIEYFSSSRSPAILKLHQQFLKQPKIELTNASYEEGGWFDVFQLSSEQTLDVHAPFHKYRVEANDLRVLDDFLFPLISGPFKRSPDLNVMILTLFLSSFRLSSRDTGCVGVFKQSIHFTRENKSQSFLKTIIDHCVYLKTFDPYFIQLQSNFISLMISNSYDEFVSKEMEPFFNTLFLLQLLPSKFQSNPSSLNHSDPFGSPELLHQLTQMNSSFKWLKIKKTPIEVYYFRDCILFPILKLFSSFLTNSLPSSFSSHSVLSALCSVYSCLRNITSVPGPGFAVSMFLAYFTPRHLENFEPFIQSESRDGVLNLIDLHALLSIGLEPSINQRFCLIDCIGHALSRIPIKFQRQLFYLLSELDTNVISYLVDRNNRNYLSWVPSQRISDSFSRLIIYSGLETWHPTERLIIGLTSREFIPPELSLRFLSFDDYVRRLAVLNRCSVSSSCVDGLRTLLSTEERLHQQGEGMIFGPITSLTKEKGQIEIKFLVSNSEYLKEFEEGNIVYVLVVKFKDGVDADMSKVSKIRGGHVTSFEFVKTGSFTPSDIIFDNGIHNNGSQKDSNFDPYLITCRFSSDNSFLNPKEFPCHPLETSSNQSEIDFDAVYFPIPQLGAQFSTLKNLALLKRNESSLKPWLCDILIGNFDKKSVLLDQFPSEISLFSNTEPWELTRFISEFGSNYLDSFSFKFDSMIGNSINLRVNNHTCIVNIHSSSFKPYYSQLKALLIPFFCRISLIVGPPGTGKTKTSTKLVENLVRSCENSSKILVTSHSNLAVDQIIENLAVSTVGKAQQIFRFGRHATSDSSCRFTLNGKVDYILAKFKFIIQNLKVLQNAELEAIVAQTIKAIDSLNFRNISKFIDEITQLISNTTFQSSITTTSMELYFKLFCDDSFTPQLFYSKLSELFQFLQDSIHVLKLRNLQKKHHFIRTANIVAGTVNSLVQNLDVLNAYNIDTLLVEEASTITEPELLPIFTTKPIRIILIGDDKQLRPFVPTPLLTRPGLNVSLFTRLQRLGITPTVLDIQARTFSEIADLYRWRYDGLKDSDVERERLLCIENSFCWVDIDRKGGSQTEICENEGKFVFYLVQYLLQNSKHNSIAILTPYKKQKRYLEEIFTKISALHQTKSSNFFVIRTIDEFQGRQADIILVSLVSKSPVPSAFLKDLHRITVLLSRSRKSLVIVGKRTSFGKCTEWRPVFRAFERRPHDLKLHFNSGYVFVNTFNDIIRLLQDPVILDQRDAKDIITIPEERVLTDLEREFLGLGVGGK